MAGRISISGWRTLAAASGSLSANAASRRFTSSTFSSDIAHAVSRAGAHPSVARTVARKSGAQEREGPALGGASLGTACWAGQLVTENKGGAAATTGPDACALAAASTTASEAGAAAAAAATDPRTATEALRKARLVEAAAGPAAADTVTVATPAGCERATRCRRQSKCRHRSGERRGPLHLHHYLPFPHPPLGTRRRQAISAPAGGRSRFARQERGYRRVPRQKDGARA